MTERSKPFQEWHSSQIQIGEAVILTKVKITPELFGLLQRYRISTAPQRVKARWEIGQVIALTPAARIEKYAQVLVGPVLPLAIGAFSYAHSTFHASLTIGRYCSLSWQVQLVEGNHPMDWVTTSPVTHQPSDIPALALYLNDLAEKTYQLYPYFPSSEAVTLGHDVWVGSNVLIKRGVTIGHGAVVGAGSVVTRDVPPYAVVAGGPARILRHRFSEDVVERLLASAWWHYGPEKLQPLDPRDPNAFLDRLEAAIAEGLQPLELPVLTGEEIIAAGEQV